MASLRRSTTRQRSSSPSPSPPPPPSRLTKEPSTPYEPNTKPDIDLGKFTLKLGGHLAEDAKIFMHLADCLEAKFNKSRIRLINRAGRGNVDVVVRVAGVHRFCGNDMGPNFINSSLSDSRNGALLWEKAHIIVGIITYRYRTGTNDVYIDGFCMNQQRGYRGGAQLFDFFINCLIEAGFRKFYLTAVMHAVWFYELKKFIKKGSIDAHGLQHMELRVAKGAHYSPVVDPEHELDDPGFEDDDNDGDDEEIVLAPNIKAIAEKRIRAGNTRTPKTQATPAIEQRSSTASNKPARQRTSTRFPTPTSLMKHSRARQTTATGTSSVRKSITSFFKRMTPFTRGRRPSEKHDDAGYKHLRTRKAKRGKKTLV